jgi:ABC-2 type transport system ATP-binding protein
VDGLDFSVPTGATVGLLGGNEGKTTTIAMLLGLLTDHGVHQRAGA